MVKARKDKAAAGHNGRASTSSSNLQKTIAKSADVRSRLADALPKEPWASPTAKLASPSPAAQRARVPLIKDKMIQKKSAKSKSIMPAGPTLSRGQRKRLSKKTNVMRRKHIGEAVEAQQIKFETGTLGDLNDIRLALPTPGPNVKRGPGKQTKKKLQRMLVAETAQLRAVLTHPLFQASPISTIHDHLENSIKLSKVNN